MLPSACLNTDLILSRGALLADLISLGVVALAAWFARRQPFPGRTPFRWLMVATLAWLAAKGAELSVASPGCKVFWSEQAWLAILATPTLWLLFLWRYTRPAAEPLRASAVWWLSIAPLAMWLAAATNTWHGLVYTPATGPVGPEPGAAVRYVHGPVFWLAAAYAYGLLAAGMVVAVWAVVRSRSALRRLHAALLALTLLPWVVNLSYLAFGARLFGTDPTPFSFAVVLAVLAWIIRRWNLFDLRPIARGVLLDALADPVLVLDRAGRLIDVNPAAQRLGGAGATGLPLAQWSSLGATLAHAIDSGACGSAGHELHLGGQVFELQCMPVGHADRPLGTLVHLRDVTQRHRSEVRLAQALAERDEQVRAVTRLHEAMQEQALRDPLTGLHNRRALDTFFEIESRRAGAAAQPLCVALIDVDRFKRINDTHGHAVGDEVLTNLAGVLRQLTRATDGVFRFGGEEFLVVLPAAALAQARARLQAMCEAVRAAPLSTSAGPLACTMSVGIAQWEGGGQALHELLRVADAALYRAKAAGRDRVETAEIRQAA